MCEISARICSLTPAAVAEQAAAKVETLIASRESDLGGRMPAMESVAKAIGASTMWVRRVYGRLPGVSIHHWQMLRIDALLEAELAKQKARFDLNAARIAAHLKNEKSNAGEAGNATTDVVAQEDHDRGRDLSALGGQSDRDLDRPSTRAA